MPRGLAHHWKLNPNRRHGACGPTPTPTRTAPRHASRLSQGTGHANRGGGWAAGEDKRGMGGGGAGWLHAGCSSGVLAGARQCKREVSKGGPARLVASGHQPARPQGTNPHGGRCRFVHWMRDQGPCMLIMADHRRNRPQNAKTPLLARSQMLLWNEERDAVGCAQARCAEARRALGGGGRAAPARSRRPRGCAVAAAAAAAPAAAAV
jgi:hypothetical protein